MKLIGIGCVFLACACCGLLVSRHIREEARRVEQLAMLLEDFRIYIRYQCLPLEELIGLFAEHDSYKEFAFLKGVKEKFSTEEPPMKIWCEQVRQDPAVAEPAKAILCELGNALGTTDVDGQLSALETHRLQMQKLADTMQENSKKRSALSRNLGVLGGAMLAVLLL